MDGSSNDVIAERDLRVIESGETVVARIHAPARIGRYQWCGVVDVVYRPADGAVSSRSLVAPHQVLGVDAFQFVELALQDLRVLLDATGLHFAAFGEREETGHSISTTIVGTTHKIARHLERLVEDELNRIAALFNDPATRMEALREWQD